MGHFRKVLGLQKRTAQHSLLGKLLWAGILFLALSKLAVAFGASSLSTSCLICWMGENNAILFRPFPAQFSPPRGTLVSQELVKYSDAKSITPTCPLVSLLLCARALHTLMLILKIILPRRYYIYLKKRKQLPRNIVT